MTDTSLKFYFWNLWRHWISRILAQAEVPGRKGAWYFGNFRNLAFPAKWFQLFWHFSSLKVRNSYPIGQFVVSSTVSTVLLKIISKIRKTLLDTVAKYAMISYHIIWLICMVKKSTKVAGLLVKLYRLLLKKMSPKNLNVFGKNVKTNFGNPTLFSSLEVLKLKFKRN